MESNNIILIPVSISNINASCSYSAVIIPSSLITFANRLVSVDLSGELLLDDQQPPLNSGDYRYLGENTEHQIKTLNERFATPFVKHNNWNNQSAIFLLKKNFTVPPFDANQYAQFTEMQGATIRNTYDEVILVNVGTVEFNDPWYVLDSEDNQSEMGNF